MSDTISERHKRIVERRAQGMTLRAIGEEFGICGARVGMILQRAERIANRPKIPINELSVRSANCLLNEGISREDALPELVARFTLADMRKWPNFGNKSMKEVVEWARRHGYEVRPK